MLGPATRLRAWRHLFRRIGEPMVWPSVGAALRGSTRCEGRMETREHGTPDVVPVSSMATPAHRGHRRSIPMGAAQARAYTTRTSEFWCNVSVCPRGATAGGRQWPSPVGSAATS